MFFGKWLFDCSGVQMVINGVLKFNYSDLFGFIGFAIDFKSIIKILDLSRFAVALVVALRAMWFVDAGGTH